MQMRIEAHGVAPDKLRVVPPWSLDANVRYDPAGRESFRAARGLADKFVVMYSGNHSPCHPLDTLLAAFPGARFVLPIRDCYGWLDSYFNHHLAGPASAPRRGLRDMRFRPDLHPHHPQERALADRGLPPLDVGLLHVFIRHTSASLSINENADPDVPRDLEMAMNAIAREDFPYVHTIEGPDDMPAHVKASLLGSSVTVPIRAGRLALEIGRAHV